MSSADSMILMTARFWRLQIYFRIRSLYIIRQGLFPIIFRISLEDKEERDTLYGRKLYTEGEK